MKIAIAQMCSGSDPWENLLLAQSFTEEASREAVDLVCFPENVFYRGPRELSGGLKRSTLHLKLKSTGDFGGYVLDPHHEFSLAVKEWLDQVLFGVSLGSVFEEDEGKLPFNSHLIWDGQKKVLHRYRKIHLFDYEGPEVTYKESEDVQAGENPVSVAFRDHTLGLSICFDLRFPELYRKLALEHSAHILLIPAAFTRETGRAHWHTLLRARAIENQCYVVAADQWGPHFNSKGQRAECFGHSLAYDPWGEILVEGPEEGDALLRLEIKADRIFNVRQKLPALKATRLARQPIGS